MDRLGTGAEGERGPFRKLLKTFKESKMHLIYYTVSIILYRCVRFVDMVYFIIIVQSHSVHSGSQMGRIEIAACLLVAALLAYLLHIFFIIKYVTGESYKASRLAFFCSLVLYPVLPLVVDLMNEDVAWMITPVYFISEFLKFLMLYVLEEMMDE